MNLKIFALFAAAFSNPVNGTDEATVTGCPV